jgi:predicted DNA-binding protein
MSDKPKSRVVEFTEEIVRQKFFHAADLTSKFSILLSEQDLLRLEFFAKTLGLKRAEFARELIKQSLVDIEQHYNLGMDYYVALNDAESVDDLEPFIKKILPIGTVEMTTSKKGKELKKESELTKEHFDL